MSRGSIRRRLATLAAAAVTVVAGGTVAVVTLTAHADSTLGQLAAAKGATSARPRTIPS